MVSTPEKQKNADARAAVCSLLTEQSQTQNLKECTNLTEEQLCALMQMISAQLLSVGIYPHLLGYHYLRSAVIHGLDDPQFLSNLSLICYPQLAKEFHTNVRCVERAIRHALERANSQACADIFSTGRKSNREFLMMFTEHIRIQAFNAV